MLKNDLFQSSFNDLRSNSAPTRETFMTLLSNIEGFLIRATYDESMASVTLKDVSMDTAVPTPTSKLKCGNYTPFV